jgi:Myb/SANT-like DNA-binding domain
LLNELIQQVEAGKRSDSGFKKEAWVAVTVYVNTLTIASITLEQCKNKVDMLKGYWKGFNWLRDQSGFGYNEETGLIKVLYNVWENVIKVSLFQS